MTSDHIDRAAEVIDRRILPVAEGDPRIGDGRAIAQALDAAGLLVKCPRLAIEGDWLVEVVDYHTCGAGPGSGAGHEPGCGSIPVARLVTPEHDAAVAAKALRAAADVFAEFTAAAPTGRSRIGWDSARRALLVMADGSKEGESGE